MRPTEGSQRSHLFHASIIFMFYSMLHFLAIFLGLAREGSQNLIPPTLNNKLVKVGHVGIKGASPTKRLTNDEATLIPGVCLECKWGRGSWISTPAWGGIAKHAGYICPTNWYTVWIVCTATPSARIDHLIPIWKQLSDGRLHTTASQKKEPQPPAYGCLAGY